MSAPPSKKLQLDYSWYKFLLPYATHRLDAAGSLLDDHYHRAIDLGCANGTFLINFASHFDKAVGYDISRASVIKARQNALSARRLNLTFTALDLNKPLPLDKNSVDLVISVSTLEYLSNPYQFLDEIKRVLKPDGQLILHTMNLAFLPRRIQLLTGKIPTFNSAPGWQGGIVHNFTWTTLEKLLIDHGFTVISRESSGLFSKLRSWNRNLLCSDIIIKAVNCT